MMTIYLGTVSKQKTTYVDNEANILLDSCVIVPIDVNSGVSDQPTSLAETESGAKNRAYSAWNSSQTREGDISLGVEAGLAWTDSNAVLVCVACIYDGKSYYSSTVSGLSVPRTVSDQVRDGAEFGTEIRKYLGAGPKEPYTFSVIKELVDREISFKMAIHTALTKWQNSAKR